jgi:hypothetical protein
VWSAGRTTEGFVRDQCTGRTSGPLADVRLATLRFGTPTPHRGLDDLELTPAPRYRRCRFVGDDLRRSRDVPQFRSKRGEINGKSRATEKSRHRFLDNCRLSTFSILVLFGCGRVRQRHAADAGGERSD